MDFSLTPVYGHSCNKNAPCAVCGDLDGCHLPGKLRKVEPELMAKMANDILISREELLIWASASA